MTEAMVVNVPPYEGEYEFDLNAQMMSPLEWEWVTAISGYLPAGDSSFVKGLEGMDPKLFVGFSCVAMVRAGKIEEADVMMVADAGKRAPFDGKSITYKSDSEDVEADPTKSDSPSASQIATGENGNGDSESSPENSPQLTSGSPALDTGSLSARLTSVE
jgi:hypothetical protein